MCILLSLLYLPRQQQLQIFERSACESNFIVVEY